jgi:hypothetical protein
LETRGILDNKFPKFELFPMAKAFHTYTSKATGVDSDTTEAGATLNQQALQSRASSNDGVQRGFRDGDLFKRELLKLREVKRLDGAVGKVTLSDGGNTKGVREAEGGCPRWLPRRRWTR